MDAPTQVLAAPTNERRALRVSGEKYKNLSKKAQIILVSFECSRDADQPLQAWLKWETSPPPTAICGFIGLVLIGFIIFVVWVKKDVGEKIRDRVLDWRIKRRVSRSTRRILKELEAVPDPPSTAMATATAKPKSSAKNDNSRDNLMVPSSPRSKAATDISTQSEKEQQQLPPCTETAEIRMPQPAHIQSQPDPSAPVPDTRELKP
ncbi:hypothetical protein FS837_002466 [Tulasnella sp. UAMH 9824]|nr:hypothetical protein FS837_002466 [Tulasnella sp. UAMH 9824]